MSNDPNYQYLLKSIDAFDQLRKEKVISLNLKERQSEREKNDKERLDRENARRVAVGLKPVATLEALEKTKDEIPDALLDEASEITADLDVWCSHNQNLNAATTRTSPASTKR